MATLSESVSHLATECEAVLQEKLTDDQMLEKILSLSLKKEEDASEKSKEVPVEKSEEAPAETSEEDEDKEDDESSEEKEDTSDDEEENDLTCEKTIVFTYDEKRLSITNYTLKGEKRLLINEFDFKKSDFLNLLQSLEQENEDMLNTYGPTILIGMLGFCAFSIWLLIMLQSLGKM
jgi:hypothetical protein